ncbi:MAG: hypothetical protein ACXVAX_11355 [Pseudobdellovibrio sp.]
MNKNFILPSIFTLFFALNLFAESYTLNADYYVRSTNDFGRRDKNIVGVLAKGSTFTVVNKVQMRGGAEALEVRATRLTTSSYLNDSDHYWIYKGDSSHFTRTDSDTNTQSNAAVTPCVSCAAAMATNSANDLATISHAITTQDNVVPPPAVAPNVTEGAPQLAQEIRNYSNSPELQRTISYALKHKSSHSQGQCYRSVKQGLACAKRGGRSPGNCLIPSWYSGEAALSAKDQLKDYGFVNLLEVSPYNSQITLASQAPKGAVLVYSSGIPCQRSASQIKNHEGYVKDCGHIEIKTGEPGEPGYVSDYYSDAPITETAGAKRYTSRYKLVGVMVKPME